MCAPLGLAGKAIGKVAPAMAGGLLGNMLAARTKTKNGKPRYGSGPQEDGTTSMNG